WRRVGAAGGGGEGGEIRPRKVTPELPPRRLVTTYHRLQASALPLPTTAAARDCSLQSGIAAARPRGLDAVGRGVVGHTRIRPPGTPGYCVLETINPWKAGVFGIKPENYKSLEIAVFTPGAGSNRMSPYGDSPTRKSRYGRETVVEGLLGVR